MMAKQPADDWYWAAANDEPARDRFVIANGKEALWARVRAEIDRGEHCGWEPIHPKNPAPTLADILELMVVVVPSYRVNHNRFVFEAARIPVFASFLRNARSDLGNYVSNSTFPDPLIPVEPYSSEATDRLGRIVSATLGVEPDWYEY